MEDLNFDDIKNYQAEVHPITFLGKQAYVKKLAFDEQIKIAERFKGRLNGEADMNDMKYLVACTLCNREGVLICPDPDDAVKAFGGLDGEDLIDVFNQITDLDTQIKEAEKNLKATP